ncbi:MAG: methyltransferase [Fibrobacterota bacterium]
MPDLKGCETLQAAGRLWYHHQAGRGGAKSDKTEKLFLKQYSSLQAQIQSPCMTIEAGTGLVPGLMTESAERVIAVTSNYAEYLLCRKNGLSETVFDDICTCELPGNIPCMVFRVTKSRLRNRLITARALQLLSAQGQLIIIGGKREGITALEKELAPRSVISGSGARILVCAKEQPGFMHNIPDFEKQETTYPFGKELLRVSTPPGLFSHGKTDRGTALLTNYLAKTSLQGQRVLDVGTGSGVLSKAALLCNAPAVTALDISAIACNAAAANCPKKEISVRPSYICSGVEDAFDIILTNPPFHEESRTNYRIAGEWLTHIAACCHAETDVFCVANSFLPYFREGRNYFTTVTEVDRAEGFTLYRMKGPIQ